MFKASRRFGLLKISVAIWGIFRLFVNSLVNKTDIITEYEKECDATAKRMMKCIMQTEGGRAAISGIAANTLLESQNTTHIC